MKRISILILFLFTNLIVYHANAKLVYNCKSVHLLGKKYKDVNVVFMTGYELLENMKDNEKGIVKVKKYAAKHCAGKIVSVLEGGYDLKSISESSKFHVKSLAKI